MLHILKLFQIFNGNYDAFTPYSAILATSPLFTVMKIYPKTWHGAPAMRLQIFGCQFISKFFFNEMI